LSSAIALRAALTIRSRADPASGLLSVSVVGGLRFDAGSLSFGSGRCSVIVACPVARS
jgi:hypothetical protein